MQHQSSPERQQFVWSFLAGQVHASHVVESCELLRALLHCQSCMCSPCEAAIGQQQQLIKKCWSAHRCCSRYEAYPFQVVATGRSGYTWPSKAPVAQSSRSCLESFKLRSRVSVWARATLTGRRRRLLRALHCRTALVLTASC